MRAHTSHEMIFSLGVSYSTFNQKAPFLQNFHINHLKTALPLSKSVVGAGEKVVEKSVQWVGGLTEIAKEAG